MSRFVTSDPICRKPGVVRSPSFLEQPGFFACGHAPRRGFGNGPDRGYLTTPRTLIESPGMTEGHKPGDVHQIDANRPGAEPVRAEVLRRYGKLAVACVALAAVIAVIVAWLTPLDESAREGNDATELPKPPSARPTVVLPSQAADVPAEELRTELFQLGEKLLAQFPKVPEALHVVAGLYADLQRVTEAERIWQDCIRLSPENVGPYVGLATAAMEQGKDEEAVATLQRGLAAGCTSPELDHQLAAALTKLGRLDEAAKVLQRGLEAFSTCPENWLQLGQIQIQLSRFAEAEASLRKAIDSGTGDDSVYFSLATACAGRTSRTKPPSTGKFSASGKPNRSRRGTRPFKSATTSNCGRLRSLRFAKPARSTIDKAILPKRSGFCFEPWPWSRTI